MSIKKVLVVLVAFFSICAFADEDLPVSEVETGFELPTSKPETGKGFYFSAKTMYLITKRTVRNADDRELGLSFTFGGMKKHFLMGGDVSYAFRLDGELPYISSFDALFFFGYRGQPAEWFQIIPGAAYGLGISRHYISFGGPNLKMLFGKRKGKFEIAQRLHVLAFQEYEKGYPYQVMMGFAYAPSKK